MKTLAVETLKKFDELPTSKVVLILLVALLVGDKGLTTLDHFTGVDRILDRMGVMETNIVAAVCSAQEESK